MQRPLVAEVEGAAIHLAVRKNFYLAGFTLLNLLFE
jgi:hypothetical protein